MPKLLTIDFGSVWGGQEIYSQLIMHSLINRGWEVTSLSAHFKHSNHSSNFNKVQIDYSSFPSNARLVNDLQCSHDIVHFNGIRAIYLANICKKVRPFIGSKHSPYSNTDEFDMNALLAKVSSAVVFCKLDWLISISSAVRGELPYWVRKKSSIIMNGVPDFNMFSVEKLSDKTLTICFVGRFIASKGVMRLLQALNILKNMSHSFRLLLAGDGPLEEEAKKFVHLNGL